jgi:hypothetical protein
MRVGIAGAGARESDRFESISTQGRFSLQNLRFDVAHHPQAAISSALRHLCRSKVAITNDRFGPNFADLS